MKVYFLMQKVNLLLKSSLILLFFNVQLVFLVVDFPQAASHGSFFFFELLLVLRQRFLQLPNFAPECSTQLMLCLLILNLQRCHLLV